MKHALQARNTAWQGGAVKPAQKLMGFVALGLGIALLATQVQPAIAAPQQLGAATATSNTLSVKTVAGAADLRATEVFELSSLTSASEAGKSHIFQEVNPQDSSTKLAGTAVFAAGETGDSALLRLTHAGNSPADFAEVIDATSGRVATGFIDQNGLALDAKKLREQAATETMLQIDLKPLIAEALTDFVPDSALLEAGAFNTEIAYRDAAATASYGLNGLVLELASDKLGKAVKEIFAAQAESLQKMGQLEASDGVVASTLQAFAANETFTLGDQNYRINADLSRYYLAGLTEAIVAVTAELASSQLVTSNEALAVDVHSGTLAIDLSKLSTSKQGLNNLPANTTLIDAQQAKGLAAELTALLLGDAKSSLLSTIKNVITKRFWNNVDLHLVLALDRVAEGEVLERDAAEVIVQTTLAQLLGGEGKALTRDNVLEIYGFGGDLGYAEQINRVFQELAVPLGDALETAVVALITDNSVGVATVETAQLTDSVTAMTSWLESVFDGVLELTANSQITKLATDATELPTGNQLKHTALEDFVASALSVKVTKPDSEAVQLDLGRIALTTRVLAQDLAPATSNDRAGLNTGAAADTDGAGAANGIIKDALSTQKAPAQVITGNTKPTPPNDGSDAVDYDAPADGRYGSYASQSNAPHNNDPHNKNGLAPADYDATGEQSVSGADR